MHKTTGSSQRVKIVLNLSNTMQFELNGFLIFFFYADTVQKAFKTEIHLAKQNRVSVLTVRKNWISSSPSPPSAMAVVAEPGAVD